MDLSLPVRLANLAAGAKLEIYKITASEGTFLLAFLVDHGSNEADYIGITMF